MIWSQTKLPIRVQRPEGVLHSYSISLAEEALNMGKSPDHEYMSAANTWSEALEHTWLAKQDQDS